MKLEGKLESIGASMLGMMFVIFAAYSVNHYLKPQKPVMVFLIKTTPWVFVGDTAQVTLYGLKDRDECDYVKGSELALALVGGKVLKQGVDEGITYEWVDANKDAETFPAGYIQPDPSRWSGPLVGVASKLGVEIVHDCDGEFVTSRYWYSLPEKE